MIENLVSVWSLFFENGLENDQCLASLVDFGKYRGPLKNHLKTSVFAAFNELDLYNRPRKPRPNAPISYSNSDASDAPLEFSMLGDALPTPVQYEDENDEAELEEMMEQSDRVLTPAPVNMIMVRGAKHRKLGF